MKLAGKCADCKQPIFVNAGIRFEGLDSGENVKTSGAIRHETCPPKRKLKKWKLKYKKREKKVAA